MAQRMPLEPVERRATADIIADLIRERIMDGTFEPGQQLGEVQLAEQLDVSRGPVREALQRLIQEGILEGRPHRGVFVVELGPEDVTDVYRVRRAIEQAAAQIICEGGVPGSVERLGDIVDKMDRAADDGRWARLAELDRQFHQTLVDGSESPRLARTFRTLLTETRLCLAALRPSYPKRSDLVAEHRAILDALRRGAADEVTELIAAHLDDARASLTADPSNGI